jgi:hypothetical protein
LAKKKFINYRNLQKIIIKDLQHNKLPLFDNNLCYHKLFKQRPTSAFKLLRMLKFCVKNSQGEEMMYRFLPFSNILQKTKKLRKIFQAQLKGVLKLPKSKDLKDEKLKAIFFLYIH